MVTLSRLVLYEDILNKMFDLYINVEIIKIILLTCISININRY